MDIDWIVAISIFLFFTAWSFSYYFMHSYQGAGMNLDAAAEDIQGKVLNYLSATYKEIPVRFNSSDVISDAVLYVDYNWPFNKNTTKVVTSRYGTSTLNCKYVGDRLYWQSDLSAGFNYFWITMVDDNSTPLNCNGTFDIAGANQTIPWVEETDSVLLADKINDMLSTPYNDFKNSIMANRNFRIKMNISGNIIEYGSKKPKISDIYLRHATRKVYNETNIADADIDILVW